MLALLRSTSFFEHRIRSIFQSSHIYNYKLPDGPLRAAVPCTVFTSCPFKWLSVHMCVRACVNRSWINDYNAHVQDLVGTVGIHAGDGVVLLKLMPGQNAAAFFSLS